jgi:hypothetical protein
MRCAPLPPERLDTRGVQPLEPVLKLKFNPLTDRECGEFRSVKRGPVEIDFASILAKNETASLLS